MKTVSIAKMRKFAGLNEKFREYSDALTRIASAVSPFGGELFSAPPSGKRLVIVLSSDRGLCGGFDNDILKLADGLIQSDDIVMPIGSVAARHYDNNKNVVSDFADSYKADRVVAEQISRYVFDAYGKTLCGATIVYASAQSHSAYKPTVKTLLPIPMRKDGATGTELLIEPSRDEVVKTLVPMYLSAAIYGALIDNAVSENSARSSAMTAATDSADELIAKLSVEYNRARQASVTEQITEIIGSVSALDGQGDRQ